MIINLFKFNQLHYLLYSAYESNQQGVLIKGGQKKWHVYRVGKRERTKSFIKERPSRFKGWGGDVTVACERSTNFMYPGFSFTVQALQLPMPNTRLTTTTKHMCGEFLSLVRHSQKHVCLQKRFQSYVDVTALSLSLCIQELIL